MSALAVFLFACLAMGVLATLLWVARGPRGVLAIHHSLSDSARWRVWLACERAWLRLDSIEHDVNMRRARAMESASFVEDVCVRLGSVWVGGGRGYARMRIRTLLYGVRLVHWTSARRIANVALSFLAAYAFHPGRYEAMGLNDSQLIAEALDASEPDETSGAYGLFLGPFAFSDADAVVTYTAESGFFSYATYPTRELALSMWNDFYDVYLGDFEDEDPNANLLTTSAFVMRTLDMLG